MKYALAVLLFLPLTFYSSRSVAQDDKTVECGSKDSNVEIANCFSDVADATMEEIRETIAKRSHDTLSEFRQTGSSGEIAAAEDWVVSLEKANEFCKAYVEEYCTRVVPDPWSYGASAVGIWINRCRYQESLDWLDKVRD